MVASETMSSRLRARVVVSLHRVQMGFLQGPRMIYLFIHVYTKICISYDMCRYIWGLKNRELTVDHDNTPVYAHFAKVS